MRVPWLAAVAIAALLFLAACQTPGASRSGTIAQPVPTIVPATTLPATPSPALTPAAAATPIVVIPTATPATLLATPRPPTLTPKPTATPTPPPPTATPATFLPFPTPMPTAAPEPPASLPAVPPTPTPTPTPVPTPLTTPVPDPAEPPSEQERDSQRADSEGVDLKIEPSQPFAGRGILFTLDGVDPWQEVLVQFVDPSGQPAEWVRTDEVPFSDATGAPVTKTTLYAGESGRAEWLRVGTKDSEGVWSVRITINGQSTTVTYLVKQLQLPGDQVETIGVELRKHQGPASTTYYSSLVPPALVVDLQSPLARTAAKLDQRVGLRSLQIPNIYLSGNRSIFEEVARAKDIEAGPGGGYFLIRNGETGIYMRTDLPPTQVRDTLTHEFVHLVLHDTTDSTTLPAWLNEGTAKYYEYVLGIEEEWPGATRARLYRSADLVKAASVSGNLLSLPTMEDQDTWNSQRSADRIELQYAQAHMAVRYMSDTYGATAPIDIMKSIGRGAILTGAINQVLGLSYPEFERQFVAWLKTWEDPKRSEAGKYIRGIDQVMAGMDSMFSHLESAMAIRAPLTQRLSTREGLVSDVERLSADLAALSLPVELELLHADGLTFLERTVRWLAFTLEHERDYEYILVLDGIIGSTNSLNQRRSRDIESGVPLAPQIQNKQVLISEAEELLRQQGKVTPRPGFEPLKQQGLTFLGTYIQWLILDLEHDQSQQFVSTLAGINNDIGSIIDRRWAAIQSEASSVQRVLIKRGLVSDAEALRLHLGDLTPPPGLEELQEQGLHFLDSFALLLTLELESVLSDDTAKLTQANNMIAEVSTSRNLWSEAIRREDRDTTTLTRVNNMVPELNVQASSLLAAINLGFNDTSKLDQAHGMLAEINARRILLNRDINDIKIVYNLPGS